MNNRKKIILLILILLAFFINSNVFANANVDYEVTSVKVDKNGYMELKGWGRLFAGYCPGNECFKEKVKPNLVSGFDNTTRQISEDNRKYESGYAKYHSKGTTSTSDSCGDTYNGKDVRYIFQLNAIDSGNGNVLETVTMDRSKDSTNIPKTTLTYSLCQKSGSSCSWGGGGYVSGCYHDVGWYFRVNAKELGRKSSTGAFTFQLTIISGYDNSVKSTVNIAALTGAIDDNDELTREYIEAEDIGNTLLIQASRPNGWKEAKYSASKYWSEMHRGPDYAYRIHSTSKSSSTGETWYYIQHWKKGSKSMTKGKYVWVPASWIIPQYGTPVMEVKPPETLEPFQDCSVINTTTITNKTFTSNTCNNNLFYTIDWTNTNGGTCKTIKNTYYQMSCGERAILKDNNSYSNSEVRLNSTVDYNANILGQKQCTFTFNYDLWKEDYDTYQAVYNQAIADKDTEYANTIKGYIDKLNQLSSKYDNFVKTNTSFTYPNINATVTEYNATTGAIINSKTATKVVDDHKTNNDYIISSAKSQASKNGKCHTINNIQVCDLIIGYESTQPLEYEVTLSIPQFILKENGKQKMTFSINKIGSYSQWTFNSSCVQDVKKGDYYYRETDNANPFDFRSNNSTCDDAGLNWCDDTFDFTKIATNKSNDEDKYAYSIKISKSDIVKIQESNNGNKKSGFGFFRVRGYNETGNYDCTTNSLGVVSCNSFFQNYTSGTKKGS